MSLTAEDLADWIGRTKAEIAARQALRKILRGNTQDNDQRLNEIEGILAMLEEGSDGTTQNQG